MLPLRNNEAALNKQSPFPVVLSGLKFGTGRSDGSKVVASSSVLMFI